MLFVGRLRSLSLVFVFLSSSMGVPGFWPYSAHKKESQTSRRSHRMASSSPRTYNRPVKYPASRTLRVDTLSLFNGKDVVSQQAVHSKQLNAFGVHVWLISSTAPSQRSIQSASGTCPQAGSSTRRTQEARTRRYRRKAHAPHYFPRRLPAARS